MTNIIMENTILRAEKDEENSCMVIETEQGQDWVSCAECRLGEIECSYLKKKWGIDLTKPACCAAPLERPLSGRQPCCTRSRASGSR